MIKKSDFITFQVTPGSNTIVMEDSHDYYNSKVVANSSAWVELNPNITTLDKSMVHEGLSTKFRYAYVSHYLHYPVVFVVLLIFTNLSSIFLSSLSLSHFHTPLSLSHFMSIFTSLSQTPQFITCYTDVMYQFLCIIQSDKKG